MGYSRFALRMAGLGIALGLAAEPAAAGERKSGGAIGHARLIGVHAIVVPAPTRSSGDSVGRNAKLSGHAELSFVSVSPLGSEVKGSKPAAANERRGPATPASERKNIKFFQMSSRLGEVSLQPVVGGVNGAQVSLGF